MLSSSGWPSGFLSFLGWLELCLGLLVVKNEVVSWLVVRESRESTGLNACFLLLLRLRLSGLRLLLLLNQVICLAVAFLLFVEELLYHWATSFPRCVRWGQRLLLFLQSAVL